MNHMNKALKHLYVNCDGSIEGGNPGGWAVAGYVVRDEEGILIGKAAIDLGKGDGKTNNVAEHTAVQSALKFLAANNILSVPVTVRTDSKLVVEQLNECWQCYNPILKLIVVETWRIMELFNDLDIIWVPRTQNKEADEVSRSLYPRDK